MYWAHCTTSVHLAVSVCEFDVLVDLFADNNVSHSNLNIVDKQGDTALQKAILFERGNVVELLASMGAKCGNVILKTKMFFWGKVRNLVKKFFFHFRLSGFRSGAHFVV